MPGQEAQQVAAEDAAGHVAGHAQVGENLSIPLQPLLGVDDVVARSPAVAAKEDVVGHDERLAHSELIAGSDLSVADIAALVACDFAKVLKKRVGEQTPNLKRWYDAVSSRPSAAA